MKNKTLLRLAWRNLGRNHRRTLLMISIVALGTWAIVVLWGITEGFFKTMIDAQVQLDTADLQIHRAGYLDDPSLELGFSSEVLQIMPAQFSQAGVEKYSPRLILEALLKSSYGATGVQLRGFDPNLETRVTTLKESLVDGKFLEAPGEILLGRKLSENLDVRLGERVVIEVQGLEKPTSRAFRAVGFLTTGLPLLDQSMAFITLADAQMLSGLTGGATEIALSLPRGSSPESFASRLREKLGSNYSVSTLFDLNPLLRDIIQVNYTEMFPIMFILSLLAGFGVANTVMFTVLERTREFGVMIAVGLKPKHVSRLVLFESVLASFIGFLAGGIIGYLMNFYLSFNGMDFGSYSDIFPEMGMPHVVYAATSGWYWLYGLSVVVLTALVAAWYPARRVTALEPTEAIRYV